MLIKVVTQTMHNVNQVSVTGMDGVTHLAEKLPSNTETSHKLLTPIVRIMAHPQKFSTLDSIYKSCQDRFSSTILLGGPGMQGTNEEVSPDTSRCWLVRTIKSGSYGRSPGTREALGVSPGFCGVSLDRGKVDRSSAACPDEGHIPEVG